MKKVVKKIGIVCGVLFALEIVSTIVLNFDEIKACVLKAGKNEDDIDDDFFEDDPM